MRVAYRLHLSSLELLPVNLLEEAMRLELLDSFARRATQSLVRLLSQEACENVLRIRTKIVWQLKFLLDDVLLNLGMVIATEWRLTGEQVASYCSQTPPVNREIVWLALHDLWSHVVNRAQDAVRAIVFFS